MGSEVKEIKKYALKRNLRMKNNYAYGVISPGFLLFLLLFVHLRWQLLPNLSSCCCIKGHPLDIIDTTVLKHCSILTLLFEYVQYPFSQRNLSGFNKNICALNQPLSVIMLTPLNLLTCHAELNWIYFW